MKYINKIAHQEHYDPLPGDEVRELYAAEAADKLLEIMNWVLANGVIRTGRTNVAARAATLGYILGRYTERQAAQIGGVTDRRIRRLKGEFCERFGIEKQNQNGVIRRKKEGQ